MRETRKQRVRREEIERAGEGILHGVVIFALVDIVFNKGLFVTMLIQMGLWWHPLV